MAGADIRRFSADRRGARINALLGSGISGLAALSDTLILPSIVLAFFVGQLTRSYTAVGLVAAIGAGLWALARLPAAVMVAPQRRKQPWALGAALVRAATLALLAFVTYRVSPASLGGSQEPLLRSFFICFAAYAIANGFASVPTEAMLAKSVPDTARAQFYRQRAWIGAALALVGGLIVARLLREGGPQTPQQFGLLFLAAAICNIAVAVFIASVREPTRVAESAAISPLAAFQQLPQALANSGYRRFLFFRVLLSATTILDPFLVLFAVTRLGVSSAAVGAYALAYVLGMVMSGPVWAALARRYGERACLQVAALLRLAPPLLALLLPYIASTQAWRDRVTGAGPIEIAFGAIFWCIGAATAGQARGNFGYLGEFAPSRLRPAFATITNAVLGVVAFIPIVGGIVVERWGYDQLFLVTAVLALLAVFASGALTNAFVRPTSASSSALRLRRDAGGPGSPVMASAATFAERR